MNNYTLKRARIAVVPWQTGMSLPKRREGGGKNSFTIYFMKMFREKKAAIKWKFVLTEVDCSGRVLLIRGKEVASYPQTLKAFQNWNPFISP